MTIKLTEQSNRWSKIFFIQKNKWYKAKEYQDSYQILCDDDITRRISKEHFISIQQSREKSLLLLIS